MTADAWTNDLLGQLGVQLPLTVLQEQVTYLQPAAPEAFAPDTVPGLDLDGRPELLRLPVLRRDDDQVGRRTAAATPSTRTPAAARSSRRPSAGWSTSSARCCLRPARAVAGSKTCLYTLTPDRDFALGPLPGHEGVVVGLAAAHGMKFAPTFGRLLAEVARDGRTETSIEQFRLDRPALTGPVTATSWLV